MRIELQMLPAMDREQISQIADALLKLYQPYTEYFNAEAINEASMCQLSKGAFGFLEVYHQEFKETKEAEIKHYVLVDFTMNFIDEFHPVKSPEYSQRYYFKQRSKRKTIAIIKLNGALLPNQSIRDYVQTNFVPMPIEIEVEE